MIEALLPLQSRESPAPDGSGVAVGLPVLQSAVIPSAFHHGFTTRAGGVSEGPFASLNLGVRWGDERSRVDENHARLRRAVARPVLAFATQVHGAVVRQVAVGETAEAVAKSQADAVMAIGGEHAVGSFVADCGPVLVADPRTGAFAAAHAGWRGTVAGVLPATLSALRRAYGSRIEELRVAIGPCIGPCCFEVGPEVVEAVLAAWPWADEEGLIDRSDVKPHVDLPGLNRAQARRAGVPAAQIDASGGCTSCDPGRFFSYRRDKGLTGLHAAFIAGPG